MSAIKRVTILTGDSAQTVFNGEKKKRKSTRMMRPLEKLTRRVLKAGNELTEQSLDRHERSSRKKKDGWAKDLMKNSMKANRKAFRKLVKV